MKSRSEISVRNSWRQFLAASLLVAWGIGAASAQSPLVVYSDSLQNGFQDWGWATRNYANAAPVHSGSRSVSVTLSDASWQGIQIVRSAFDSTPYASVTFWINGGPGGGQRLRLCGLVQIGSTQNVWQTSYTMAALPANTWQQLTLPLSALGLANRSNTTGIAFQDRVGAAQPTFYLDDIQFDLKPGPNLTHISLNASSALRTVDLRHFGINLAIWDDNYGSSAYANTAAMLKEMDCRWVRVPAGSLSDEYHWSSGTTGTNTWQWVTDFAEFMRVATNANAQAIVTVNYGSGSPEEAAAWVAYANGNAGLYGTPGDIAIGTDATGRNWRTVGYWARLRSLTAASNPDNQYDFLALGRSTPLGVKYWEIGNECYGTWERDTNNLPNHAYTYAVRATNYLARMKTVDPTIEAGVVGAPGEDNYDNGYRDHPAVNPRTGQTHYGWTPILLATLKKLGVTPDFLVHHHYPQWTNPNDPASSPDNDTALLQSTGNWAADAAALRQHITDYFGTGGTNIELVVTENNSDSGAQGRQSTSLVNGLYYADSLGQLLKTEFNGFMWWNLRNGTDTGGYFGANVYGWRSYGDLGVVNGAGTRHPAFYAAKLMSIFARPGDRILNVTSDYSWLSAHAARSASGAVNLLVINKSATANLSAQIDLTGFVPGPVATVRSYGIPNDEAARTNAPASARDITTNTPVSVSASFTNTFAPYSMTLLTLMPPPPQLAVVSPAPAGTFVVQIQGQPDTRYVVQTSSNLSTWIPTATVTLTGNTLNLTNPISPSTTSQFWRALWQP